MENSTVYIKCDRNVEVQGSDVFMKDLADVYSRDKTVKAKCRALKVHHFGKEEPKRCVLSTIRMVELMVQECPGIQVQVIGETDVLVEWVDIHRHKGVGQWAKAAMVCLVSFFGTAFTIMAYHIDSGVNEVFTQVYQIVMGREPGGLNVLEVSYSLGLAVGIIVFFNHIGGRRLTKDPTPIEVAMRNYEKDVDMAVIETAGREGKEWESD